jgi:hypothetical protein
MALRQPQISKEEQQLLLQHLRKHVIYPYREQFRLTTNSTNFPNQDGSGPAIGFYFTYTFQPVTTLGIVSLAAGFILTPNTTVDLFAMQVSYKPTMTMANQTAWSEADVIYQLMSNGGAINDFQVFYPLNWYVEKNQPIYVHVYAGTSTISAATAVMTGHITLGTLNGGI